MSNGQACTPEVRAALDSLIEQARVAKIPLVVVFAASSDEQGIHFGVRGSFIGNEGVASVLRHVSNAIDRGQSISLSDAENTSPPLDPSRN